MAQLSRASLPAALVFGRCVVTIVLNLSYPKSGGVWLSRLLGDALNSPVGALYPPSNNKAIGTEGQGRTGGHDIRHGHGMPVEEGDTLVPGIHKLAYKNLTTEKIILLLRDPRDICVSGAHHWDRPLIDYIHCVGQGKWPMTHGGGLVPFVRTWLDSGLVHCITRYEWLHADTEGELRRILGTIEVPAVKDIKKVVHRQSFEVRRRWTQQHGDNLNYGKDFQIRFLRKGITGDWKNVFSDKEIALCEHYFGDLMDELGYQ